MEVYLLTLIELFFMYIELCNEYLIPKSRLTIVSREAKKKLYATNESYLHVAPL